MLTEQVAEEVRVQMARKRLSQEVVAKAIGRSQSYVSRRLTGEVPFDVNELERLAALLAVPVTDLVRAGSTEQGIPITNRIPGGALLGPRELAGVA